MPQAEYSAGALAAALFIISGVRGMERGTIFMGRLEAVNDWPEKLVAKFKADFGDSL